MWRSARFYTALILLVFLPLTLTSQEEPVPYAPKEFPQWARDLRRAEIIFIGSFPLSVMFTTLIYDFSIYAASGFDPLNNLGSNRDDDDIFRIVMISLSVSTLIAVTDLIIEQVQRKRKNESTKDLDAGLSRQNQSQSRMNFPLKDPLVSDFSDTPFVPSFYGEFSH